VRPVAVVGNLSLDRVDGGAPRPGGGPFHAARALRALQRPAILLVRCAAADRAALVRPLARLGIPTHWRAASTTARFAIDYSGEERTIEVDEPGEPWQVSDVAGPAELGGVEWVHVAPLTRADFPASTLAAIARGRRLSLDGQGLVRPAGKGALVLDAGYDPETLRDVSILKLAEEEARALVGEPTEEALRGLGVPEVVLTLGSRGSLVVTQTRADRVPARPVAPQSDPTGAGDAFAAAYLVARAGGFAPPAAARWASGIVSALLSGRVR
jgi:sugar/nucleoside kinase (ribokinase family)